MASSPIAFPPVVSVKLNGGNFLIWRQQIEALIKGHRLHRFVVNTEIPRQFLSEADRDAGNVNEEYLHWEEQEQLLFSWLLSTLSEPILTRVVGCARSWQLWDEINNLFSTLARAKMRQFRSELYKTKKGTESVAEYVLRIKILIDNIAYAGSLISTEEHIDVILEGLPREYDAFVISIYTRLDSYTVREIEDMLLTYEARIKMRMQSPLYAIPVNVAPQSTVHTSSRDVPISNSLNQFDFDQQFQFPQQQFFGAPNPTYWFGSTQPLPLARTSTALSASGFTAPMPQPSPTFSGMLGSSPKHLPSSSSALAAGLGR